MWKLRTQLFSVSHAEGDFLSECLPRVGCLNSLEVDGRFSLVPAHYSYFCYSVVNNSPLSCAFVELRWICSSGHSRDSKVISFFDIATNSIVVLGMSSLSR